MVKTHVKKEQPLTLECDMGGNGYNTTESKGE